MSTGRRRPLLQTAQNGRGLRLLLDITREHVEHGPEDLSGEAIGTGLRRPVTALGR